MTPARPRFQTSSSALRTARQSWRLLYSDSRRCIALAESALARAMQQGDVVAEAWARLSRGFHLIWYATPAEAMEALRDARRCFEQVQDRPGQILAEVGLARAIWRAGDYRRSLEHVLPLRDEGLRLLERDERGILLNTIAGCYSELGDSRQALAYMYQAMREASAAASRGFDVVLYCNLAHELIQLGDYHQASSYLDEGLRRCAGLDNQRLLSVLRINRVICLTALDRPAEALPDLRLLLESPADRSGRGQMNAHYETLAIAAVRAGEIELGAELVPRAAAALAGGSVPDEQLMLQVAGAELMLARGRPEQAAAHLHAGCPQQGHARTSLRVRCEYFHVLAEVHERLGQPAPALAALREWQRLHLERSLLASSARFQAAALHTELLRLQQQLLSVEARRRSTERARAELQAMNEQLERKVAEVEALRLELQQQATRDFLTGLFNRRHLDDVLPSMLAMAQRDRQPLAVVIIDLDHFKTVNDAHGHAVGDRLLADFGALLGEQCRRSDVACRYGGEEFCLLMPRTAAGAARRKCLALLKLWSSREQVEGARTFSAGVADSATVPRAAADLLAAADAALLQAKRSGRNRVLVHDGAAGAGSRRDTTAVKEST